jgi:hypothetical protein
MSHYTFTEKDIQRFWAKVDKSGGDDACWLWQGSKNRQGYGSFGFRAKILRSHRASWLITHGDIPQDMCVCHRCDNPSCVNPSHLFLGTRSENVLDMYNKGRGRIYTPSGEKHWNAKLTKENVLEIRRVYKKRVITAKMLAELYGVNESVIQRIISRDLWKDI